MSKAKLTDLDVLTLLLGSRKMEKSCGLFVRSGLRLMRFFPGKQLLLAAKDGGGPALLSARHLPPTAAHIGRTVLSIGLTSQVMAVKQHSISKPDREGGQSFPTSVVSGISPVNHS